MAIRPIKIYGTGKSLPKRLVTINEVADAVGADVDWIRSRAGVETRYFVENETSSQLGAEAAHEAMSNAKVKAKDIDVIVCTSGTYEQPLPSSAALLQRELGRDFHGIPCFDIDSTCLSFVTGLDLISCAITVGRFKKALLISTEVVSPCLNVKDKESYCLFGDAAAAAVVGLSDDDSGILASNMATYSDGADDCRIVAGGTKIHPRHHNAGIDERFLFAMDGKAVFKLASQVLPPFTADLLDRLELKISDLDLVIPHQASLLAVSALQKRLEIPDAKLVNILAKYGNTVAASIPLALHEAIESRRLERGQLAMLIGTSAGFSVGAIVLRY